MQDASNTAGCKDSLSPSGALSLPSLGVMIRLWRGAATTTHLRREPSRKATFCRQWQTNAFHSGDRCCGFDLDPRSCPDAPVATFRRGGLRGSAPVPWEKRDAAPLRPRRRRVHDHSYVDESSELTLEGASGFTAAGKWQGEGRKTQIGARTRRASRPAPCWGI